MGTLTLRKRLGVLRGVLSEVIPYRDPHTAGPALWARSHQTGEAFEKGFRPHPRSACDARNQTRNGSMPLCGAISYTKHHASASSWEWP
jgi:hypothetical protein